MGALLLFSFFFGVVGYFDFVRKIIKCKVGQRWKKRPHKKGFRIFLFPAKERFSANKYLGWSEWHEQTRIFIYHFFLW